MSLLMEGTGAPESEGSGTTDVVTECVDEKGWIRGCARERIMLGLETKSSVYGIH